jgi:serine/threonine protein phosphatase PrpC
MGNSGSHRDSIPDGETPEFTQLSSKAAVVSFQGLRTYMEDAFDALVGTRNGDLYAVYDGHGGKDAVSYVKQVLLRAIAELPALTVDGIENAFIHTEQGLLAQQKQRHAEYTKKREESVQAACGDASPGKPPPLFLHSPLDVQMPDESGTCVVMASIKDTTVTVATCGDCTALLVLKSGHHVLVPLHKPYESAERDRIERAGLEVMAQRVKGELAVSRSIGDFQYKGVTQSERDHAVTCVPSVISFEIDPSHCCLLLFSDGISDGVELEEIASLARQPESPAGKQAGMEATLLTSYEKSKDNQTLLRIDF